MAERFIEERYEPKRTAIAFSGPIIAVGLAEGLRALTDLDYEVSYRIALGLYAAFKAFMNWYKNKNK